MAGIADEVSSTVTSSSPLLSFMSISPSALSSPNAPWLRELKSDERGLFLIHLLLNCATQVAAGNLDQANAFLEHISFLASPAGDAMQRIASFFTEALARRLLRFWPGLYRALNPDLPDLAGAAHARRLFLDLCPFLRLCFLVSNLAILEAMEGEKVVHVVDLGGSDPAQWVSLLQSLAGRPDGPPHLRITAVSDRRDLLSHTASALTKEAEKLDIPFQFNAVVSPLESLDFESLRVKTGEALAVSSVLQLHSLLAADDDFAGGKPAKSGTSGSFAAGSISQQLQRMIQLNSGGHGPFGELLEKEVNGISPSSESSSSPLAIPPLAKMENFLASVWGLSPKIMVVTEQESNHNGLTLNDRFMDALNFYAALFDCLESTVPRQSPERSAVEKLMFGEEIKNIIACEGLDRKERHEKLERWIQRMEMAGFGRVPMSYCGLLQARRMLLGFGCDGYKVKEENGSLLFCWQERALYSVSAWRSRRYD
ncbi:Scarecrow-like protein 3 [Apostasia shenzhenica]|uniref:Scarecrow-like protein 3 n=1 Tax=Apostasia shenzhenica TaxID=1088818 RepID=A0A2I0B1U5_9ASPA|nr:Scarecrow-like protein 3 [Apostasia shenzhenica]